MKIRIMKLIYCCIKNEGHSNRKKEKSFPFQSNLGVQKYSIIKKIAHSRNSLQTYNKKKERNKIMKLQQTISEEKLKEFHEKIEQAKSGDYEHMLSIIREFVEIIET